jgi:hypothetical protein
MIAEQSPIAELNRKDDIGMTHDNDLPIRILIFAVILIIPFRIVGLGFLPSDDALRHVGKAMSGREWSEILVLRPGAIVDSHPGWHAILGVVHRQTGWNGHSILLFAVIGLFVVFSLGPLVLMRRPEAWLFALLAVTLTEKNIARLMHGRPLIFTAAVVVTVCLLWPRVAQERTPWATLVSITGLIAMATWIHGSWYLMALPIGCFFLAQQWRAAKRLSVCVVLGVSLGAILTGQPLTYLTQNVVHGFLALGNSEPTATLVTEFRPFAGAPLVVGVVLAVLAWRVARGRSNGNLLRDPVFVLMAVGWVLGFVVSRFYTDWAIPALLVFLACEMQDVLESSHWAWAGFRFCVTTAVAVVLALALSADADSHWSEGSTEKFLSRDIPVQAALLPEPGGILYSVDMRIFYRTFFRNPDAPWRYILGFESALMPPEDLEIYRSILNNHGATAMYLPWVRKMKPADRLVIRLTSNTPPAVPGLEWYQPEYSIWIGRLPDNMRPKP